MGLLLWDKAKDFLTRAFTVIFVATIIIWFLQSFDIRLNVVADSSASMLAGIGRVIAPVFAPLGFTDWARLYGSHYGLFRKGGSRQHHGRADGHHGLHPGRGTGRHFLAAGSVQLFDVHAAVLACVAAIAAVKREMRSGWGAACVALFQCAVAWVCACLVYQIGSLFLR